MTNTPLSLSRDIKVDQAALAQYQAANDRRFQNFNFFWQASGLGLAAQAFLFAVALDGSTSNVGRIVAGVLSIFVSWSALVLMRSQRGYQRIEGRWMDLLEKTNFAKTYKMDHDGKQSQRENRITTEEQCQGHPARAKTPASWRPWKGEWHLFQDATQAWTGLWVAFMIGGALVAGVTIFGGGLLLHG